jgi:hypothetical protein
MSSGSSPSVISVQVCDAGQGGSLLHEREALLHEREALVGRPRVCLERRARQQFGGPQPRSRDRRDLVVITVRDEDPNVDLLEVVGEVGLGERLDEVQCTPIPARLPSSQNSSRLPSDTAAPARLNPESAVEPIEGLGQRLGELRPIVRDTGAVRVERLDRAALRGCRWS